MVSNTATLRLKPLPATKLKRRAKQLGLTPEAYVERLVDVDLEVQKRSRGVPWEKLVEPFRKALSELSEDESDDMVEKTRRLPEKKRRSR